MAVELKVPVAVNVVYDKVWLTNLQVTAGNPKFPIKLVATIQEARVKNEQTGEIEVRGPSGAHHLEIPDFFKVATPEELTLMNQLVEAIAKRIGVA